MFENPLRFQDTGDNATEVWLDVLSHIIHEGSQIDPRGKPTLELPCYISCVDMNYPVVDIPERKLGYKFMAAEAAWILSGDNRVETIKPYANAISNFSDDGVRFHGAYGPKLIDQISYVIQCLKNDNNSRQAVINIWRENPMNSKDIPCTISVQWFIRDGKLHCVDTMRSSDIWLGWPYDVFNFSIISQYIAHMLALNYTNVEIGNLYLVAGSQHLYGNNFDDVKNILSLYVEDENPLNVNSPLRITEHIHRSPDGVSHNRSHIEQWLWDCANSVGVRQTLLDMNNETD